MEKKGAQSRLTRKTIKPNRAETLHSKADLTVAGYVFPHCFGFVFQLPNPAFHDIPD